MKALTAICLWTASAILTASALAAPAPKGTPPKREKKATPKTEPKKEETRKEEAKKPKADEEKPFAEVVKEMEVIKGIFTFYRHNEDNRVFLEIEPSQMGKIYLFGASVDQAVGEKGFYSAQMGGEFPFFFRQIGKTIQLVIKNTMFTATNGTPAGRATARSFPNAILGSAKIASQPHPDRKSILVNLADLLVADLPGFAVALKETYKPTEYRFDKNNSFLSAIRAFPENALLEVALHYTTENPRTQSITLPDPRSVPILVKYDLSSIKETGYKPRMADDRLGHFLTLQQDFSSDHPSSPYVRQINRWHLEKADPSAALSQPKQPIVFWLENTIPVEYRAWMKEGALLWNKAFERIGFKDALVVHEQPDNADWDPADTRYNTLRWFATVDASFAIGPSRANPFTGQIYDADIGFSEGIIRSIRRNAHEFIAPSLPGHEAEELNLVAAPFMNLRRAGHAHCDYADGLAHQAAFGVNVLAAFGQLTPEVETRLMREFIIELTAHEVGHTLGLRHNFRGSALLKPGDLHDTNLTAEVSQSSSVMDYNPIVLARRGQKQGHFVPVTLGPYDYWAIEYAYKTIEGDEKTELAKIASRVADPALPYSTDGDALGTFSPNSIDPLANQYDQSSDPVAYFKDRLEIVREYWTTMEEKLVRPGEGYQILRRAAGYGLSEYYRGLRTVSKFVGGIYHYRDHVGDPGGRTPYVPVPAAKQREALLFLSEFAYGEKCFELPASLLNKLAAERLPVLSAAPNAPNDFPWHDSVIGVQRSVLARMFDPATLNRLLDNELRFGSDAPIFRMSEMFETLEQAIWAELKTDPRPISSLRRNLQREHLKEMIRLVLRSKSAAPEDATTLARAGLNSILKKVESALEAPGLDSMTSAHLAETRDRINAALKANLSRSVE